MKYAIAYLRVSTEEQTVENQRLVLQKWADSNGFTILHFFEDAAVSGKIPAHDRIGFRDMLELLKAEKFDAVLVFELSRVGRTFWDTLAAIKTLEKYAPLISCSPKEVFLQTTDPSVRKLLVGILSWVAERERENICERTRAGLMRAKASGKKLGRPEQIVDKDRLIQLLGTNMNKNQVAKELGVCKKTLYKEIRRLLM